MTEWSVVTVIITLVGLGAAVIKPLIQLNSVIVSLTEVVKVLECNITALEKRNTITHDEMRTHIDEHGDQLQNHETRLTIIERTSIK